MTITPRPRLWVVSALVPTALAAMLACGCVAGPGGADPTLPAASASADVTSPTDQAGTATRVTLRLPDGGVATATLQDAPAAEAFAAMLPVRLTLHDPLGQAKSGQLPRRIDLPADVARTADPTVGAIYYWPPSADIAIVYDDLGQTVPAPGMVLIGMVDGGLDLIAAAGNRFTVQIDPA